MGSSSFASWIIDGYAKNSNGQDDIDLMNQFINKHSESLQGSLPSIQASVSKAELNIQWNILHSEKVIQWLKEHYGKKDDENIATRSNSNLINSLFFIIVTWLLKV